MKLPVASKHIPAKGVAAVVPDPIRVPAEMKIGYALLIASSAIYAAVESFPGNHEENYFMIFFLHYFLALTFTVVLIIRRSLGIAKSWRQEHIHSTMVVLNLFLISAYALNREVNVFQDSTAWLCILITLTSLTALSFRIFSAMPPWVNRIQYFVLGSALVLYLYLALFVAHYYIFGSIGIIAFGIGAHVFVPLLLIIGSCSLIRCTQLNRRVSHHWITGGAVFAIVTCVAFVVEWNTRVAKIDTLVNQSVLQPETQLPIWVRIGQVIGNDWISQRILKSDLVYTTAPKRFGDWEFFPGRSGWEETRKHDPLVFLGSLTARTSLSKDDRIKILTAIANARHQTEERLWSGTHLSTPYIVSDVNIYPDLRLAYTEKYFTIRNNLSSNQTWRNTEEALYTFQLPKGSVCTSLSLWINGIEQKGILTSKQKASNAYKTIVGVEQRDPAVVHWQEGNTVTVRVFPCTNQEDRKFKIGITSPLQVQDGKTHYENITFFGPNAAQATETTRIRILGSSADITLPDEFAMNENGDYISEHTYDPDFEISFPTVPLKRHSFTFGGNTYSMAEYKTTYDAADFTRIYLDLNQTWTKREVRALKPLLRKYHLLAYKDEQFIQLTDEDWSRTTENLSDRNFSIFPFHLIKDTDHSLVITKGDEFTPHLSDFKESAFGEGIRDFFGSNKQVKVYNLTGGVATYINSLRELRALQFYQGDIAHLKKCLDGKYFPRINENENHVILEDASLVISKEKSGESTDDNTAPDHIARLFAYNNIMRKVGAGYFHDDFINEGLVKEAALAYVVSPVSSLIVLESQADYDRFDIADKGNSLYNASRQSSGAVPEPHEWALIVIFVLFILFVKLRH